MEHFRPHLNDLFNSFLEFGTDGCPLAVATGRRRCREIPTRRVPGLGSDERGRASGRAAPGGHITAGGRGPGSLLSPFRHARATGFQVRRIDRIALVPTRPLSPLPGPIRIPTLGAGCPARRGRRRRTRGVSRVQDGPRALGFSRRGRPRARATPPCCRPTRPPVRDAPLRRASDATRTRNPERASRPRAA